MLMCVGCFGLVVSTCQVIGWKDPSEETLTWWEDYLHKAQVEESVCVYFSFVWFVCVLVCSPRPYTIYIFHTPTTRYSLFVLKASLNTNKPNQPLVVCLCCCVFPPALHNIYFICLWHDIAYMCWKCR